MGTQELENAKQGPSPNAAKDSHHVNLLSLHKAPKSADVGCYVSSPSIEKQKDNFFKAQSMYVTGEPSPTGCVFNYSFLYSLELGSQFKTSADATGLKDAVTTIQQRESSVKGTLQKKYGIDFGKQGEAIRRTLTVKNHKIVQGPQLIAKNPSLPQLAGIAEGLKHSFPDAQPRPGSAPIKFFAATYDHEAVANAEYSNKKERPQITLYDYTNLLPVTSDSSRVGYRTALEREAKYKISDPAYYALMPKVAEHFQLHSIQQTVEHELAHHAEHRIGWDDQDNSDKFAAAFGWVVDPAFSSAKNHEYMIRGKNGEYYAHIGQTSLTDPGEWLQVDAQGWANPRQVGTNLKLLSAEEVASRAAFKPATDYFPTPLEMMAESMSLFRDGAQSRRELLENDAKLYFESKREDQLDINVTFGLNAAGEAIYIRDLDGTVVFAAPETVKNIALFEERVQKLQTHKQQNI